MVEASPRTAMREAIGRLDDMVRSHHVEREAWRTQLRAMLSEEAPTVAKADAAAPASPPLSRKQAAESESAAPPPPPSPLTSAMTMVRELESQLLQERAARRRLEVRLAESERRLAAQAESTRAMLARVDAVAKRAREEVEEARAARRSSSS